MRRNRAQLALVAVAVLHALAPIVVRGVHAGYGWDETTYLSQINRFVPAGAFTAPRARGVTLLVAPITLLTSSVAALRLWLAAVSGVGLWVAFRPWLRLRNGYVVSVAALLWSSLWVTIYYGFEAMPNEYSALGAVAATGWLLVALRSPAPARPLLWTALAVTFVALIRPTDALCLVIALAAVALVVRGLPVRLRALAVGVLLGGLAAGAAEWVAEAYVRFGGPIARLHAASTENTGGLHWSLGAQWRVLAGPILCRSGCQAHAPGDDQAWWLILGALVVVGVAVAWRHKAATPNAAALAVALALATEYIAGIAYAAPRFLLPTYALLAIPAAEGICWLVTIIRPAWRPVGFALLGGAFIAQSVGQVAITRRLSHHANVLAAGQEQISAAVNADGVHAPCDIAGINDVPIAYFAGCLDLPRDPSVGRINEEVDGDGADVVVVQHRHHTALDKSLPHWATYTVHTRGATWTLLVSRRASAMRAASRWVVPTGRT